MIDVNSNCRARPGRDSSAQFNLLDCEGRISLIAGLREFRREVERAESPHHSGRRRRSNRSYDDLDNVRVQAFQSRRKHEAMHHLILLHILHIELFTINNISVKQHFVVTAFSKFKSTDPSHGLINCTGK